MICVINSFTDVLFGDNSETHCGEEQLSHI